ncbi:MAG TPA: hypothetical protein VJS64_20330 [Pyrinomonadaceae bacterium]|nr:hypothetical protein [Pyrinomonadaceae bacterium]
MSEDIKEKFGTGWIGTSSASGVKPSIGRSGYISDRSEQNVAFLTLGKQIVRFMMDAGGTDKFYSLADKMKIEPQDLSEVVEWLANNYYIRVEPEQFGNHEIRLTDRAKELVST